MKDEQSAIDDITQSTNAKTRYWLQNGILAVFNQIKAISTIKWGRSPHQKRIKTASNVIILSLSLKQRVLSYHKAILACTNYCPLLDFVLLLVDRRSHQIFLKLNRNFLSNLLFHNTIPALIGLHHWIFFLGA